MLEIFDKDRPGIVLRMERSSVHDGSGFRTVVFLKGCPLCCQWCSTPESQSFMIEKTKSGAYYGQVMTVEEVMKEIRKDALFYFHSGGGVTLSGGEMLAQSDFSLAILKNAKHEGINTAIETCFFAPWENIRTILPYVNTAFVDLKLMDEEMHKRYCGASNDRILQNLLATNDAGGNFRLVVRIPILPGINDSEKELHSMGAFCAQLNRLDHVQLLPYHKLGTATYQKLGRDYLMRDMEPPTQEHMAACREIVRNCGVSVK